jgi:hypothetical protein
MKIGFQSNQLSLTGTEVALYDYAHHNERELLNESVILYQRDHPANDPLAINRFQSRFNVIPYTDIADLDRTLASTGCDLLYTIKSGKRDNVVSRIIPTMVHAVFPTSPAQIHGASYAYISPWLSKNCSLDTIPSVSHIVEMPTPNGDLRAELGIPKDALVIGSYGGRRSFDIPCAIAAVKQSLERDSGIRFLFMNFEPFLQHPRAHFLPGVSDLTRKAQFIASCDAMLHARLQGESFGLAVGEFSVLNKPVMAYRYSKHTHHLSMLGNRALIYEDTESLVSHIESLPEYLELEQDWDCYSQTCNPRMVMAEFDRHLIKPALASPSLLHPNISIGPKELLAYWYFKAKMRFGIPV